MSQVSQDEALWGLVAWVIPLAGGILGLITKPSSPFVRHWSHLSIAFGIVIVVVGVFLAILGALTEMVPPIHVLITVISYIIWLIVFLIWVIGIVRERSLTYWKPPVLYDIAKAIAGGVGG